MTATEFLVAVTTGYLAVGLVVSAILGFMAVASGAWAESVRETPEIPVLLAHALVAITLAVMLCRDAVLWPWAVAEAMP